MSRSVITAIRPQRASVRAETTLVYGFDWCPPVVRCLPTPAYWGVRQQLAQSYVLRMSFLSGLISADDASQFARMGPITEDEIATSTDNLDEELKQLLRNG